MKANELTVRAPNDPGKQIKNVEMLLSDASSADVISIRRVVHPMTEHGAVEVLEDLPEKRKVAPGQLSLEAKE